MTFADKILSYQFSLQPPFSLPNEVQWLLPYEEEETRRVMVCFYQKYYSDNEPRTFLLGINPGRFGAGITGVPFTDPIRLELLGIENSFPKRQELSSVFIYEMIHACGGPENFYKKFYITSLSPLGLVRHGKNYNYYDDKEVSAKILDYIVYNLNMQAQFGSNQKVVFCLGQGKNFTYLEGLNKTYRWWERVEPLPHPRWIMQYKLKQKDEFLELYRQNLLNQI